jgi:hypothetical protein
VTGQYLPGWSSLELKALKLLEEEKFPARRRRVQPEPPSRKNRPKQQFGPQHFGTRGRPPTRTEDPGLWAVREKLLELDPTGTRTAYAIRESFDQAYDGQRTGRWDFSQLMKTEKTHIGTLVEMWLQREFGFKDGEDLDYSIAGQEVDAKWSRNLYEWEIPLEMYTSVNQIALLVWGNEYTLKWVSGLLRIRDETLKPVGKQRDRKRQLSEFGKDSILWVHESGQMIENTLVHLPDEIAWQVAQQRSGQAAVDLLFTTAPRVLINRATIDAAAQQVDAGKRVRDSRVRLRERGIVVFGHYAPHPAMATALGLPSPTLGRFISAQLAPWSHGDPEPKVMIDGAQWRLAREGEGPVSAPKLPEQGR